MRRPVKFATIAGEVPDPKIMRKIDKRGSHARDQRDKT